jgi:hypothetical protein
MSGPAQMVYTMGPGGSRVLTLPKSVRNCPGSNRHRRLFAQTNDHFVCCDEQCGKLSGGNL